jgi:ribosome biogenesis GTPase
LHQLDSSSARPSSPRLAALGWDGRVQAAYSAIDPNDVHEPARVTRVERGGAVVATASDDVFATATALPAVGDWVAITRVDADHTRIQAVVDRWSRLARLDPDEPWEQVLAANLDLAFITAPADRCSPARVEREIALVWDSGARPVVVVTKCDLDPACAPELEARLATVDVIETSAVTHVGVDQARDLLRPNRTAVLLGPSGAGKSTLANALLGEDRLATGAVRADDRRGRHTTAWRELVTVPGGGVLIDTPGLRSLGLAIDADALGATFTDVEQLARQCRFRDCRHDREPGCAVNDAVSEGGLDPDRLRSYRKLQREIAADARKTDVVARKQAAQQWKVIHKAQRRARRERGE